MVWTTFTSEQMDAISRQAFMPLMLLVNYTLFQYLVGVYWPRRKEKRMIALFTVGFLGVICLIPFANPDDNIIRRLNDVSESCCALTFLIQITVVGYDLNKKIKFKTILYLTHAAELLIVADIALVVLSLLCVIDNDLVNQQLQEDLPNIGENITLAFILFFRYYYVVASRGWRDLWENRKAEIGWYLLFTTHELPFIALAHASGLSWEAPQSLWNRITLAGCLYITAKTKLRRDSARTSIASAGRTYLARSSLPRLSVNMDMARLGSKANIVAVASANPPLELKEPQ